MTQYDYDYEPPEEMPYYLISDTDADSPVVTCAEDVFLERLEAIDYALDDAERHKKTMYVWCVADETYVIAVLPNG